MLSVVLIGWAGLVGGWAQGTGPELQILHTVDTPSLFLKGGEDFPQQANVTLTLSAARQAQALPLDLVLVFDRSATTELAFLKEIGEAFLAALSREDRIALVSFAEEASVDVELTSSAQALRIGLDQLRNIGKTAIGDGLFAATQHLLQRGRPEALWVEVLVTDGRANAGRDPALQAQRAADNGILVYTVGMGRNLDEALLSELAQTGGGSFFRRFSPDLVDEILARKALDAAAEDIVVVETLAPGLVFEGASLNPPDQVRRDPLGTQLEWRLDALRAGESWTTRYTVSATQEGTLNLNQPPSEVSYRDARGRRLTQALPTLRLEVRAPRPPNRLPVARFSFDPENPSTRDEVRFSDGSFDPDGTLSAWFWDFGDGTSATVPNPTHRYAADGTYTVSLTVTDDRGGTQTTSQTVVVVTEKLSVNRTIDTFLPSDDTLAGETFQVTLEIEVNHTFNGLGVDENLPKGWVVTTLDNAGARFKAEALQWVFLETLEPGDARTIVYEVTVPDETQPGVYNLSGIVTSASPRIEDEIDGEAQVEVKSSLPVETVLSRWDPQADALDLKLSNQISFEQVQLAVAWWLEGKVVPHTGGEVIDFLTVQALIARWLTGTPIDEPLPDS